MMKTPRDLPAVGTLLNHPDLRVLCGTHGRDVVSYALRQRLTAARAQLESGEGGAGLAPGVLIAEAIACVRRIVEPTVRPVINATGIVLHTNLGRAVLGRQVLADLEPIVCGYSNLEFDLERGARGDRNDHLVEIVRYLTGAEEALVVNNNAAALVLILNALAANREVIISRGELIEIGGSFRLPEIMAAAGVVLREVGATNRTRLADYERAIGGSTAMLLKAHPSNYCIQGFTEEVGVADLAALAHAKGLPMVYDIGSGLLKKPQGVDLRDEPDVRGAITAGADLVCFSADKLLGGPQAGVIVGRAELMATLARAPLMRALRVGKLTLAALSSACRHYLSAERLRAENPTVAMLERTPEEIQRLGEALAAECRHVGIRVQLVDSDGQSGGGTLPTVRIPGVAVQVLADDACGGMTEVARALLRLPRPILCVLREGQMLFDVRTLQESDFAYIAGATASAMRSACQ